MTPPIIVAPHPDDEAVGCGGFLNKCASQGAEITVVFVTNGDRDSAGRRDASLAETRCAEAQAAAPIIGIRNTIHWDLPDGELQDHALPHNELAELARRLESEILLVPHPQEAHPDHAAVALLPLNIAWDTLHPVQIMTYEIWTPLEPSCVVDVTSVMAAKRNAVCSYRSQAERFNLDRLVTGLAMYRAAWSRMRSWRYAEAFGLYSTSAYRGRCHAH